MSKLKNVLAFVIVLVTTIHAFATDYYLENLNTVDTYIRSSAPNNSFDGGDIIVGGWGDAYFGLIKFNISTLPTVASGARVSVWLYNRSLGGYATPTMVQMGALATNFTSSTTWNNSNLSWYTSTVRTVNVSSYGYWTEFEITDYYNYWKNGVVSNQGFALVPNTINNNFNFFSSSSTSTPWNQKPILRITYPLALKWPLATSYATRHVNQVFGKDWAGGVECPVGVIKKHNGTDYSASVGSAVYAAENGVVRDVIDQSVEGWAKAIVIEHAKPDGSKYTTNYWHVTPFVAKDNVVTKEQQIAVVADLGSNTHFHFGLRLGPYFVNSSGAEVSGTGALPQATCTGSNGKTYPGFPELFVDPDSLSYVNFQ